MNNSRPGYPRMLTGRLLNHEIAAKQMKEQKSEALRLADTLETQALTFRDKADAAAELRRLHELNQELLAALVYLTAYAQQHGVMPAALTTARAAITKAEGDR
jgi:hypothetical protein